MLGADGLIFIGRERESQVTLAVTSTQEGGGAFNNTPGSVLVGIRVFGYPGGSLYGMQQLAACRGNHSYLRTETILPYNVECKEQVCACMRYLCEWCEYIASTSHPLPCRVFESDLSTD